MFQDRVVSDSALRCPFAGRGCVRFCQCIQKVVSLLGVGKRGATDARSVDVRCGGVGPRGNQGENTMQRRNFLIGMGSLAAGGAAVTGTGALSQMTATRAVDVAVVNDDNSLLGFNLDHSSLENTQYASYEHGSLQLHFNDNASLSNGATGLNPDATSYFDNVFQMQNQSNDSLRVDIDKSNLDNPDSIFFYVAYSTGANIGLEEWNNPNIPAGTANNVGVKIETPDSVDPSWETGYIVVEAVDEADSNR